MVLNVDKLVNASQVFIKVAQMTEILSSLIKDKDFKGLALKTRT